MVDHPPTNMGSFTLSLMADELFRAAVTGDLSILTEEDLANHGESFYSDQTTPNGNTIIHIAVDHGRPEFMAEALARFPELGPRKNRNKDTPLHIAAMKGDDKIVKLLVSINGCATEEKESWPWMARTLQGDTPLHLALRNNKLCVVMELLKVGSIPALSLLNDALETPLHVFLKYCIGTYTTVDALLEEGVMNLQGEYKCKSHMNMQRSSSMIVRNVLRELLKCKGATCMADADGLTPLHIAARQGNFMAIRHILDCCPQSAEVSDPQGQTLLHLLKRRMIIPPQTSYCTHDWNRDGGCDQPKTDAVGSRSTYYWELKGLLDIPEVNAIKDAKDSLGNTPAHVALGNGDFVLVRVLFECFADFTIKNRDGISALDRIKSSPDFATKMEEVMVTEKVLSRPLEEELIQAVEKGTLFQEMIPEHDIESGKVTYPMNDHSCLLGRTKGGLSILHLAVRHGKQTVVEEIIQHFPALALTADLIGETPLHFGARLKKEHYPVAATLLRLTKGVVDKFRKEAGSLFLEALPWRQKNAKGDTPLHEALRSSNYDMAVKLLDIDSGLSSFQNAEGETPLHILARHGTYTKSDKIRALVERLVGQNDSAVHRRDVQGFTPLLRAAQCGRIRVAYWIAHYCPSSVQFRDASGRTFLHLLRLEPTAELDFMTVEDMLYVYTNILKFRSLSELDGLRRSQDHDGNTPLHFALRNDNFAAARFLLLLCVESEAKQEMNIIDSNGHSVSDLLESLAEDMPYSKELKDLGFIAQKSIKDEVYEKKMMSSKVYMAAVKGDMNLFNQKTQNQSIDGNHIHEYDSSSTDVGIHPDDVSNFTDDDIKLLGNQVAPDGSNILHIACQHGQEDFAKKVLESYPELMFERNSIGDTPIHSTCKRWEERDLMFGYFMLSWKGVCRHKYNNPEEGVLIVPPWRVKNINGNTPIHEAVKSGNYLFGRKLVDLDPEVSTDVNHAGQTPLHECADGFCDPEHLNLYECNKAAMYVRDREGLTPLLRAGKSGRTWLAQDILIHSPESIQLRDHGGRCFLHHLHLKNDNLNEWTKKLYEMPQVDALRKSLDFEGNTPLHSAILDANSVVAKLLVNQYKDDDVETNFVQLRARNKEGQSVMDLLATHDDAPNEIMQLLIKGGTMNRYGLYAIAGWVRSSHGICKSQVKEMANTLSVVAGLLATMTFAAAFQVPGGFDSDNGNPILLRKAAFQAFLVSNALAMCGSMVVLFSLLWVMFAGSVTNSFLLLDMSVVILQFSLSATLMSFMTGVYVSTSHLTLRLAIFTCALCSIVILLMRKPFILAITRFVRRVLYMFHASKRPTFWVLLSSILIGEKWAQSRDIGQVPDA